MDKEKITNHMFKSACGYGMADDNYTQLDEKGNPTRNNKGGKDDFKKCIDSIPSYLLEDFIYTLSRIASKSGSSGFEIQY